MTLLFSHPSDARTNDTAHNDKLYLASYHTRRTADGQEVARLGPTTMPAPAPGKIQALPGELVAGTR